MPGSLFLGGVLFDTTLSNYGLFLNILAGLTVCVLLGYVVYHKNWKLLASFFLSFIGVSAFELLTGSLWRIQFMGSWAYGFWDISWILSLIWTGIIVASDTLITQYGGKKYHALKTIGVSSIISILLLIGANLSGVLSYEPEAQQAILGMIGSFPINTLYYVPLWIFFVYSFKQYFDGWIYNSSSGSKTPISGKNLLIGVGCVLGMEIIIEPIVLIKNLPSWTYIAGDLNIILLISRSVILIISAIITNIFLSKLDRFARLGYAILISCIGGMMMQSYMVQNNILVFSQSALQTYTMNSFMIGDTGLSTLYFGSTLLFIFLLIPTIKYWTNYSK